MPTLQPKKTLLRELNTQNTQTYTTADVTLSYVKDMDGQALAHMAATTTGALAGTGTARVSYNRLDLSALLAVSGITDLTARHITQKSLLLTTLSQQTGIGLDVADIVDGAITYDTNNQAEVVFTAADTSLGFEGSCSLTVTASSTNIDLADIITVTDYMSIDQDSATYVKQLISANTIQRLDWSGIVLGTPIDNTDTTSSARNSKTTLTAVPGSGYTGSVDVFFDRTQYTVTGLPKLYYFPLDVDWSGTPWQWLTQFHSDIAANYTEDQFSPTVFTVPAYTTTFTIPGAATPGSWVYHGGEDIQVNPNAANWVGVDLVMGFDASQFNTSGFTDYAGLALTSQTTIITTNGTHMSKGAPFGPFAGGLNSTLGNSILTKTSGAVPDSTFTGAFTVDMWVYHSTDVVTNSPIPLVPFLGYTTVAMNTYTDRIASFHNGSSNGSTYNGRWVLSNNTTTPRAYGPVDLTIGKQGWQHVAITYDGAGNLKYYRNGKLLFTITGWTIVAGASNKWFVGMGFYVTGQTGLTAGVERWRLRKGLKFTGEFGPQDLYPQ